MLQKLLLRQYRQVYRISHWTRRHFTPSGHLFIILAAAAAVFGVNTQLSNTYQLFVLLAALLGLSWLNSRFNRPQIIYKRQLPRYAMVGEPLRYQITLSNLSGKTYHKLALAEQLQESFPDARQIAAYFGFSRRPWFKRLISYRQWLGHLAHLRGGGIAEIPISKLTQTPLQLGVQFTPNRRGQITLANSFLACPDTLGLFRSLIGLAGQDSCLVLPKSYPVKPLNLPGKRKYQPGGVSLASSVGNSSEFMSLRDYRPGDAINSIHWKSLAKHGKLIVKEYEDEYFVRRALVLDTFAGDAPAQQFEAAVSVAASLAISERQNEALLDFMFAGQQTYRFTSGRGVDQLPHLQEILAGLQASDSGSFQRLRQAVLSHAALCSSVVCILMHWDKARQDFVRELSVLGLPLAVFVLHDGSLNPEQCPNQIQHFHLLDYRHLAEQLAAL